MIVQFLKPYTNNQLITFAIIHGLINLWTAWPIMLYVNPYLAVIWVIWGNIVTWTIAYELTRRDGKL